MKSVQRVSLYPTPHFLYINTLYMYGTITMNQYWYIFNWSAHYADICQPFLFCSRILSRTPHFIQATCLPRLLTVSQSFTLLVTPQTSAAAALTKGLHHLRLEHLSSFSDHCLQQAFSPRGQDPNTSLLLPPIYCPKSPHDLTSLFTWFNFENQSLELLPGICSQLCCFSFALTYSLRKTPAIIKSNSLLIHLTDPFRWALLAYNVAWQ